MKILLMKQLKEKFLLSFQCICGIKNRLKWAIISDTYMCRTASYLKIYLFLETMNNEWKDGGYRRLLSVHKERKCDDKARGKVEVFQHTILQMNELSISGKCYWS